MIHKARRACGNDGGQRRVIRAIYGRGLQWVAPVRQVLVEPSAPALAANGDDLAPAADGASMATPRRRGASPLATALALLAIGVALAWWLVPRGVAQGAPGLPRVALLPIENATANRHFRPLTAAGIPPASGSANAPCGD